jgi:hypothetical protein
LCFRFDTVNLPEALWTILRGAFLNEGQSTALQLNLGPDLEDQGGDGVPRQEHCGIGLQEVQVPDRGSCFEFDKLYGLKGQIKLNLTFLNSS